MSDSELDGIDAVALPADEAEWKIKVPYLFGDLGIVIEYLAGQTRTKVRTGGLVISNTMPSAYGYILRTTDIHGEEIDMYLSSHPDVNGNIYVIDQIDPETGFFDEHKVMLGFESGQAAVDIYRAAFSDGSGTKRLGALTRFPGKTFQDWLNSEGYSFSPASKFTGEGVKSQTFNGIKCPPPAQAPGKPRDEMGGVLIKLPDMSQGPKMVVTGGDNGGFVYTFHLYCALNTKVWSNAIDAFCRTLDLASENDVMNIHIASRGGSVMLMGRMLSSIKATKAKVVTFAQGCVASAATTVWAAGHERHILPGAYFMQHMSSQLLCGKTSDIAAKSVFCVEYITKQLKPLIEMGLFTDQEVTDMIEKAADIYISGRKAISRVGRISGNTPPAEEE